METQAQRDAEDHTPEAIEARRRIAAEYAGRAQEQLGPAQSPPKPKPVRDHVLCRMARAFVRLATRFETWVHAKTNKPLIRVESVTFADPFGNDIDDPAFACFEFSWNDQFLRFLWDNGYRPGVHAAVTDLEPEQMIDAWLTDCYRNAVYETDMAGRAIQEAPVEPGFARRRMRAGRHNPEADSEWLYDNDAPALPQSQRWRNTPDQAVDVTSRAEKDAYRAGTAWPGGTRIDLGA